MVHKQFLSRAETWCEVGLGEVKLVELRLETCESLGRPRGMVWGGRREEGSGWGAHVYLWRIRFDVWQN